MFPQNVWRNSYFFIAIKVKEFNNCCEASFVFSLKLPVVIKTVQTHLEQGSIDNYWYFNVYLEHPQYSMSFLSIPK